MKIKFESNFDIKKCIQYNHVYYGTCNSNFLVNWNSNININKKVYYSICLNIFEHTIYFVYHSLFWHLKEKYENKI